jgi:diguanylate cyclase (GGDEF)-like protein
MKWGQEQRAQFIVYVLSSNVDKGASYKASLAQEGFDTYLLTHVNTLLERMQDNPCHVLVLTLGSLDIPLEDFVRKLVQLSPETRVLPVATPEEIPSLLNYREFSFSAPLLDRDGALTHLAWRTDEICQSLYLQFQNEQLLEARDHAVTQATQATVETKKAQLETESATGLSLKDEWAKYQNATSKEEVLSLFFRDLGQKFLTRNLKVSALFFKYLPTVQSFVALQALGLDIEAMKGIGGRLEGQEARDPESFFAKGGIPESLRALLQDGLGVAEPLLRLIKVRGQVDGILALWGPTEVLQWQQLENEFALFNLLYERGHLIRQLNSVDLADTVTELFGRQYFLKHLNEEVSRARRLQKAVSIVKVAIDHWRELEQVLGRGGSDQILRLVATVMQKSSRVNDLVCRTNDNEFSMILPHAARKGASLRAERLRRMLEAQLAKISAQPITISCGVAEYPSHCSSFEDLETVSLQALEYIQGRGGNKVCLFQPAENFRPDFEVPPL